MVRKLKAFDCNDLMLDHRGPGALLFVLASDYAALEARNAEQFRLMGQYMENAEAAHERIAELEAENARLNMEMVAYREKLTPKDVEAMTAVIAALTAEKAARSTKETACEHEWEPVKVTGDNGVIYNCKKCGGTKGWNPGAAVETWETASKQPDEYAAHNPECYLRKYREGYCDCELPKEKHVAQAESYTISKHTVAEPETDDGPCTTCKGTGFDRSQERACDCGTKPVCPNCGSEHMLPPFAFDDDINRCADCKTAWRATN